MKAIILAAGMGTRLKSLTKNKPKCLLGFYGVSLLSSQLANFFSLKVRKIIIICGYRFKLLKKFNTQLVINKNYRTTNMLWSLFCAKNEFNESLIISYGDIAYSKENLKKILNSKGDICVAYDTKWKVYWSKRFKKPLKDLESFKIRKNNTIAEIGNKVNSFKEIDGQYIGLIKFSKKGIKKAQKVYFSILNGNKKINNKKIKKAFITDFIQELINRGIEIKGVPIHGGWLEIDTPNDLNLKYNEKTFQKIIRQNTFMNDLIKLV